jgi:site-specific DNA-cytosine methylase
VFYRLVADERNFLFEHMVSAALEFRPKLFLMENVPGMQSARRENLSFLYTLERYGRDDLMRYRRDVFDDKYARLRGDRPSKTIVVHLAKGGNGYIHPTQVRSISVREAAWLQSFHDGYTFCGSPSDQWIQVGNAVPPVLAEARQMVPAWEKCHFTLLTESRW